MAQTVHPLATTRGWENTLILTSPYQPPLAWMIFDDVFRESLIGIFVQPVLLNGFAMGRWWHNLENARLTALD